MDGLFGMQWDANLWPYGLWMWKHTPLRDVPAKIVDAYGQPPSWPVVVGGRNVLGVTLMKEDPEPEQVVIKRDFKLMFETTVRSHMHSLGAHIEESAAPSVPTGESGAHIVKMGEGLWGLAEVLFGDSCVSIYRERSGCTGGPSQSDTALIGPRLGKSGLTDFKGYFTAKTKACGWLVGCAMVTYGVLSFYITGTEVDVLEDVVEWGDAITLPGVA